MDGLSVLFVFLMGMAVGVAVTIFATWLGWLHSRQEWRREQVRRNLR